MSVVIGDVLGEMLKGIEKIEGLIGPALGPRGGVVLVEQIDRGRPPQVLRRGHQISRRILEFSDNSETTGAMVVRGLMHRQRISEGDGSTRAGLMFSSAVSQLARYRAAGYGGPELRDALGSVTSDVIAEIKGIVRYEFDPQEVLASCLVPGDLAEAIIESHEISGEFGQVDFLRRGPSSAATQYHDGCTWVTAESSIGTDGLTEVKTIPNCGIFVSDLDLRRITDFVRVVERAGGADRAILVVARSFPPSLKGGPLSRGNILAVRTPGGTAFDQFENMQDMAALSGATPIVGESGASPDSFDVDDVGSAAMCWTGTQHFGFRGGRGQQQGIRQYFEAMTRRLTEDMDERAKERLRTRIGRLLGGSVTVQVGGSFETREDRVEAGREGLAALRSASRSGVVRGGCSALAVVAGRLRRQVQNDRGTAHFAATQVACAALEAPVRQLAQNARVDPGPVLASLTTESCFFEAIEGKVVNVEAHPLADPTNVVLRAVERALRSAAQLASSEALVGVEDGEPLIDPEGEL